MLNKALARTWQSALLNFTQFQTPNPLETEVWPKYTADKRKVMNIGRPNQYIIPDNTYSPGDDVMDRERCDYWANAPYYNPPDKAKLVVQNNLG